MRGWLSLVLLGVCLNVVAQERVVVCFNYGCASSTEVVFKREQLTKIRDLLEEALDAEHERALIAVATGRMLAWAGKQSPIWADRGGNLADGDVHGKMDCIDHSTTTTRFLRLLENRGWLRWHRVSEPIVRSRFFVVQHWTAVIEERPRTPYRDRAPDSQMRYAVDSWFRDNGKPAVVQPLGYWMDWKDPDDDE